MTAPTVGTPEIADTITTALHLYMNGTPRHSDLGIHIAITLQDHYRITVRHKSRRPAA